MPPKKTPPKKAAAEVISVGAVVPSGWITKTEASIKMGRNTKTVERIARKGDVPTQYISNRGTRSITIYNEEALMTFFKEYLETPHPGPTPRAIAAPEADAAVPALRQPGPGALVHAPMGPAAMLSAPVRFWSMEEAAQLLNLHISTVRRIAKEKPELGIKDKGGFKFRFDSLAKI